MLPVASTTLSLTRDAVAGVEVARLLIEKCVQVVNDFFFGAGRKYHAFNGARCLRRRRHPTLHVEAVTEDLVLIRARLRFVVDDALDEV